MPNISTGNKPRFKLFKPKRNRNKRSKTRNRKTISRK